MLGVILELIVMRPHIVYILSDEHSGMAMSHAGDPNVSTPNMDRMANQGQFY